MAKRSSARLGCALIATALLGGCSSLGLDDVETSPSRAGRESNIHGRPLGINEPDDKSILGDGGFFGGDEDAGPTLPVNRYLWRAALDTLSFLPLASTDPYGGVIITDWGVSPNAPNERFKVTAYITSAELSPNSLRVVVNRQVQDGSGVWIDAAVAEETARQLENAILTRARVIRSGEPRE